MFEVRMGRLVVFLLILIVGAAVGEVVTEAPTAAVINVDDDVEVAVVVDLHNPYNVNIQMLENYAQHYRTIKMQKISDAFSDAVTNQCTAEVGE